NARRISPHDSDVIALVQRTSTRTRRDTLEPIRAGWRDGDPKGGAILVKRAEAAGHIDAAFLAASTMVALGTADPHMASVYDRQRVRGAVIPEHPLERDHWTMLRHKDDV